MFCRRLFYNPNVPLIFDVFAFCIRNWLVIQPSAGITISLIFRIKNVPIILKGFEQHKLEVYVWMKSRRNYVT